MSKPFPLSAFDTLTDSQPIACVQGVLTKLYDQKSGTNSNGDWSLQNGELEADGVTIPITFKDRDPLARNLKGRTILLTASIDKGVKGIYCWDDNRNDQIIRKIKVTRSASLDIVDASSGQGSAPNGGHGSSNFQQAAPASNPPPETKTQPRQASAPAPDSVIEAKRTIFQIMNLHLICATAVEKLEAPEFKRRTGHEMSESVRQGAIASIFIESCRTGLVRNMPDRLVEDV